MIQFLNLNFKLKIPYREDDNVKKLIRRAAVLLLDPLDSIEDVWFQALEDRDEADLTELTETFTDYVTEQGFCLK